MSFWDNVKKFAQPYAEDEYDEYEDDEYMDDYDEPEAPARRSPRRAPAAPAPAPAMPPMNQGAPNNFGGFNPMPPAGPAPSAAPVNPIAPAAPVNPAAPAGPVNPMNPVNPGFNGTVLNRSMSKQEVVLFRPGSFNDTTKAANDLKANKAVIVNMENVDKAMSRRVVDFLSGCVYALEGDVKKIAQSAYLFCPHNVGVVGDLEAMQAEVESYM